MLIEDLAALVANAASGRRGMGDSRVDRLLLQIDQKPAVVAEPRRLPCLSSHAMSRGSAVLPFR
jgi:hypothetical protein